MHHLLSRPKTSTAALALMLFAMSSTPVAAQSASKSTLSYSSYLGGASGDFGESVAIAANGDRVFCGNSGSPDLATPGAIQSQPSGERDVIIGRYSADGGALQFLTYLGGQGIESCTRVALDSFGNIVIAGWTASPDFPTVNAADASFSGGGEFDSDAFVAKLTGDGQQLIFSTYLGGLDFDFIGVEWARGLAIDSADRIVVVGDTSAEDFPATIVLGVGDCGIDPPPFIVSDVSDQFVVRYLPDGAVDFATCINASDPDYARDVAIDNTSRIYIAGSTISSDYPTTQPAIGPGIPGAQTWDGIVTILSASGDQIEEAVRIGSTDRDFIQNIEINSLGQLIVQAQTVGIDFPTTKNAWQPEAVLDEFQSVVWHNVVFGLLPELDSVAFSTYISGSGSDIGWSLALDNDRPVVHLYTDSRDLSVINPIQAQKGPDLDIFVPFDATPVAKLSVIDALSWFGPDAFGAVGPGPNRIYVRDFNGQNFSVLVEFDEPASDTRDLTSGDIFFNGLTEFVTGNYEGLNYLYVPTGTGTYTAIPFGDPATKTVAVHASGSGSRPCIIEFVEDGVNIQHDFDYLSGNYLGSRPYGQVATASRAVTGADWRNLYEISAADEVTVYTGCAAPGEEAPVEGIYTFEGRDFVAINTVARFNELVLADRNGGGVVVYDLGPSTFGTVTATFEGPPTLAVATIPGRGIVAAHDGGYRHFRFGAETSLVFDSEQQSADAPTSLIAASGLALVSATSQGAKEGYIGSDDLYAVRLQPDGSDADFASYLGGGGDDSSFAALAVAEPGRLVFSGGSDGRSFPVTDNALQSTNGGLLDAVLFEVDLGDGSSDADGDGVPDAVDNCSNVANPDQRDTNGDGFGNICDPDLNNDGVVNFADLGLLKLLFFTTPDDSNYDPDADFNGDDVVNASELAIMRSFFFGPPGPGSSSQ